MRRPRVIQWATGAMGKTCLRGVIDDPAFELAGLYVYSAAKAGRDAGEIARRDATGIRATDQIEDIVAIDADIVIHAPRLQPPYEAHDGDILRLLASGKNVISINGNSYPDCWSAERRDAFEQACRTGGSSFIGAGLNPGCAAERLVAAAAGLSRDIRSATLREHVLCREIASPAYAFGLLGFGTKAGEIDPNGGDWPTARILNAMFSEVVAALAAAIGHRLDEIVTRHQMLPARGPIEVAAGRIEAGCTSHVDWRWSGMAGGRAVANLEIAWSMDEDHAGAPAPLWRIGIEGTPEVRLAVELERGESGGRTSAEQLGVAATVLNLIPHVIAAPPGLMNPAQAPLILAPAGGQDEFLEELRVHG
jgi:hypothetical protein